MFLKNCFSFYIPMKVLPRKSTNVWLLLVESGHKAQLWHPLSSPTLPGTVESRWRASQRKGNSNSNTAAVGWNAVFVFTSRKSSHIGSLWMNCNEKSLKHYNTFLWSTGEFFWGRYSMLFLIIRVVWDVTWSRTLRERTWRGCNVPHAAGPLWRCRVLLCASSWQHLSDHSCVLSGPIGPLKQQRAPELPGKSLPFQLLPSSGQTEAHPFPLHLRAVSHWVSQISVWRARLHDLWPIPYHFY